MIQNNTEQYQEWNDIWSRQSLMNTIVNKGREVYNNFFRKLLSSYLTRDTSLLEMGCGIATLSLSCAPYIRQLTGIDISEHALARAKTRAQKLGLANTAFERADCTQLPQKYIGAYDVVWSQGFLEHFADPVQIARAHYDTLKPGGAALISVPQYYSYHTLWYNVTRPRILRFLWPWTDQMFYTKKELEHIGKAITPRARVFALRPWVLGIIILELKK